MTSNSTINKLEKGAAANLRKIKERDRLLFRSKDKNSFFYLSSLELNVLMCQILKNVDLQTPISLELLQASCPVGRPIMHNGPMLQHLRVASHEVQILHFVVRMTHLYWA